MNKSPPTDSARESRCDLPVAPRGYERHTRPARRLSGEFRWSLAGTSLPANDRRRFAYVGKFSTISHESSALEPALSILQLAIRRSAHARHFGTYVQFWRATCLSLIEELFMIRQRNGSLRVRQVRTHERRGTAKISVRSRRVFVQRAERNTQSLARQAHTGAVRPDHASSASDLNAHRDSATFGDPVEPILQICSRSRVTVGPFVQTDALQLRSRGHRR